MHDSVLRVFELYTNGNVGEEKALFLYSPSDVAGGGELRGTEDC